MSHEIHQDKETGKFSFAYVGAQTWHGLGQQLTPDAPIPMWIEEAGFNWTIKEAQVYGTPLDLSAGEFIHMPDRKMLYRSDTRAPLAVVGTKYNVVQPEEILTFYEDLVASGGFHLETAGILYGGKRMFALAKMHEEEMVLKGDPVKGYLLLSTACDGTMATTVMFTSVRVVCNNTLQMAIQDSERENYSKPKIKIPHSARFDEKAIKQELGLAPGSFDLFIQDMRALAQRKLNTNEAVQFLVGLLGNPQLALEDQEVKDANLMKQVYELYNGMGHGSNIAGHTAWGMLNAVTEYTDHHTGHKTDDARIDSAWFGANANLKQRAYEQLMMTLA
jgi:phage/plasmid-like protein (TIGR03299 family)